MKQSAIYDDSYKMLEVTSRRHGISNNIDEYGFGSITSQVDGRSEFENFELILAEHSMF